MTELTFKSPKDGSILELREKARYEHELEFEVGVRTPWFSGRAPASTFMNGSPLPMFQKMAEEWQGWVGKKSWSDLESRVTLAAHCDSTGHVQLAVELTGQDFESRLRVVIGYEAGQLEGMAAALKTMFGQVA
jgi:hypothetical protein